MSQQAERGGLLMAWKKQEISLNRLMGKKWDSPFSSVTRVSMNLPEESEALILAQVQQRSPALLSVEAQLLLAESAIKVRRDAKQDNLDLILSVGNKTNEGDTLIGSTSESELVGSVQLEFNRGMDKSGFDAELYQSQIDRGIALQNKQQVLEDLTYELSSLLAEFKAGNRFYCGWRAKAVSATWTSSVTGKHQPG